MNRQDLVQRHLRGSFKKFQVTPSFWISVTYGQNIQMHKTFIMFILIGIWKTRNTDDSLGSGTKLLLPSLSLGFRHEERETQFFYADCSSIASFKLTDSTNAHAHPAANNWTGLAQTRIQIASSKSKSQLTAFINKNPSLSLPGMTSYTSPGSFSIWGFYCDICDCHILLACVWTPALNVCT